MTMLRLAHHSVTGRRICEVYDDTGTFIATITPGENGSNSIFILSEHLDHGAIVVDRAGEPPVIAITFNRK